jgi:hypothetical protein
LRGREERREDREPASAVGSREPRWDKSKMCLYFKLRREINEEERREEIKVRSREAKTEVRMSEEADDATSLSRVCSSFFFACDLLFFFALRVGRVLFPPTLCHC